MQDFVLKDYKKTNTNTKVKVFIEYLYEKFGVSEDSEEFYNDYFTLFNENDLVESLKYYIAKNKVTSQIAANNYITFITHFFKELSEDYNIKNEIFINIETNNRFLAKSKEIISKLKLSESKDVATDEQYEALNNGIKDFLNLFDINDLYDEIEKYKNNQIYFIKIYYRFISILPTKLIMKFALKNLTVVSLTINDVSIENKILYINGFNLPLDDELIKLLNTYLKIRKYILDLYSLDEDKLFVKINGSPFLKITNGRKNAPDYASFFKIIEDIINTWSAEIFASKRIIEMIENGIDLGTIAKLTDRSTDKLINLQMSINREESVNSMLLSFFNDNTSIENDITIKKKGFLDCPFCGDVYKAISDEWVLVELNDGKKYLSCRKCKGKNGKFF